MALPIVIQPDTAPRPARPGARPAARPGSRLVVIEGGRVTALDGGVLPTGSIPAGGRVTALDAAVGAAGYPSGGRVTRIENRLSTIALLPNFVPLGFVPSQPSFMRTSDDPTLFNVIWSVVINSGSTLNWILPFSPPNGVGFRTMAVSFTCSNPVSNFNISIRGVNSTATAPVAASTWTHGGVTTNNFTERTQDISSLSIVDNTSRALYLLCQVTTASQIANVQISTIKITYAW